MKSKYLIVLCAMTVILSLACALFSSTRGALKFEPESLPDAQVGADYEAEIHVTENNTPVGEFWISEGILPTGLELIRLSPLPSSMGYHATKRSLPLVPL